MAAFFCIRQINMLCYPFLNIIVTFQPAVFKEDIYIKIHHVFSRSCLEEHIASWPSLVWPCKLCINKLLESAFHEVEELHFTKCVAERTIRSLSRPMMDSALLASLLLFMLAGRDDALLIDVG